MLVSLPFFLFNLTFYSITYDVTYLFKYEPLQNTDICFVFLNLLMCPKEPEQYLEHSGCSIRIKKLFIYLLQTFSCGMWALVPRPGIESGPPASGA